MLTLFHFVLDALLGRVHLLNLLVFAQANLLRPLGISTVQLLQEVLFSIGQLLLRTGQVLIDRLDDAVSFGQSLV